MRINRLSTVLVALMFLAMPACSDSTGPGDVLVSGQWSGSTGGGSTLTMTLTEQMGGSVTGSGNLSGPGGAASLTISGVHVFPNVSLSMESPGFEGLNFTGLIDEAGANMSGTLNGSGFQGSTIDFARQ